MTDEHTNQEAGAGQGRAHAVVNAACCALFVVIGAGFLKALFVAPAAAGELPPMTRTDVLALVGLGVINFYGALRCYRRSFNFWVLSVAACAPVVHAALKAEGSDFPLVAACYVVGVLCDGAAYYSLSVETGRGGRSAGMKSLTLRRRAG